jgi:holo-[acyl-carrier protein] synthase
MIIGIGIDIVDIKSFTELFNKSKRFRQRVFTENEIEYCENKPIKYQHYAARFAAKEALMKAIGTGWAKDVQWKHIEVISNKTGRPSIQLYRKVKEIIEILKVKSVHVSLSHSDIIVGAFIILET